MTQIERIFTDFLTAKWSNLTCLEAGKAQGTLREKFICRDKQLKYCQKDIFVNGIVFDLVKLTKNE